MTLINQTVRSHIDDFLTSLEHEYDITVLFAVAHGSHAWGLSNDNSDYDIKIVYAPDSIHHFAYLTKRTSSIDREYQGEYDIEVAGWDIKKFASLLEDSNDQAIDTLRSPIVYRETFDRTELRDYILDTFSPIALYHAYRGITKNNYRDYLSHHLVDNNNTIYPIIEELPNATGWKVRTPDGDTQTVDYNHDQFEKTQTLQTVKRNLAVMKGAMSANYLRRTGENGTHRLPNIDFPTFLTEQAPDVFDTDRIETAQMLVEEKRAGNGSKDIGDVVGREFAHPDKEIDPQIHASRKPEPTRLNEFIDTMLNST